MEFFSYPLMKTAVADRSGSGGIKSKSDGAHGHLSYARMGGANSKRRTPAFAQEIHQVDSRSRRCCHSFGGLAGACAGPAAGIVVETPGRQRSRTGKEAEQIQQG